MSLPTLFSYLPEEVATQLCKFAEEESRAEKISRTAARGLVGTGVGMLAGGGAAYGGGKLYEHLSGKKVPSSSLYAIAPVLGAASGLAYSLYRANEMEEFRRALESAQHRPDGGNSGE